MPKIQEALRSIFFLNKIEFHNFSHFRHFSHFTIFYAQLIGPELKYL